MNHYRTIANGAGRPINAVNGTMPDVSGAYRDWFQPMIFQKIKKLVIGFEASESQQPVAFRGMIQPLTTRQLQIKPEGQRAWSWYSVHTDAVLPLQVDDIVAYDGRNFRVMALTNYVLNGFMEYELAQDWRGSDPLPPPPYPENVYDGGNSQTASWLIKIDSGSSDIVGPITDGGNASNPVVPNGSVSGGEATTPITDSELNGGISQNDTDTTVDGGNASAS